MRADMRIENIVELVAAANDHVPIVNAGDVGLRADRTNIFGQQPNPNCCLLQRIEYVLAMKHNLGLNKILGTIHSYPTLAEANKYAAGEWKRAHAPQALLRWVERFHAWRRG